MASPSRDVGSAAEHFCAGQLLYRGSMVAWPSSQQQPYDLIADTPSGRHRIQVKGTNTARATVEFRFQMRNGSRKRCYTKQDADFIVLYLFAHEVWYIFPVGVVKDYVNVKPTSERCKYLKYRDAWHLIDASLK